ncbi:HAD family hydrolase [Halolamina sp.]|jgi:HAD-superfamily hydrolase, subfamily IIIA|uniref:HAD family hydrolase n=1 Tax=Halolamina sp. TaxID=1940283 RepID=UPI000223B44E|nr:HAD-superfamily hydrolase, subfamily IA, variant 1 [halophilic archaeon DL31]
MQYRAVLFDLDDTLYPYPPCNEAGKQAAFETFQALGYDVSHEPFRELYQEARREVKRELTGTAAAHERFLYFKRLITIHTGSHHSGDTLALGEAYWEAYLDEMELFAGVEETFAELQEAGIDVAIVSNLTTRIQLKKLRRFDLEEQIDYLLTSEETGREKPSSVMFTLTLARLDTRPSEALMVGDSPEADIEGGNAVGLSTALVNNDTQDLADWQQPDFRLDTVGDVLEVAL